MHFLNIPSELTQQIVGGPELDTGQLHNLSLTCKHLRNFAEDAMYREIILDYDQYTYCAGPRRAFAPHSSCAHRCMESMAQLLRTIVLDRPELALRVRSISLPNKTILTSLCRPGYTVYQPLSTLQFWSIANQIHIPKPYLSIWREELCKANSSGNIGDKLDCLLSLLLAHLPNLKHLHLGEGFTADRFNFITSSKSTARCLGTLLRCTVSCEDAWPKFGQNLEQVTIAFSWRDEDCATSTVVDDNMGHNRYVSLLNHNYILPFFYLPRVREVEIAVPNPKYGRPPFPSDIWPDTLPSPLVDMASCPPPRSYTLRSIKVNRIREDHLKDVLSWMPHLQELDWTCSYGMMPYSPAGNFRIDLDAVCSALSHVKESLTSLTIRTLCFENVPGGDTRQPAFLVGSLVPLHNFPNLKQLEIPMQVVFGDDVKPTDDPAVPTWTWKSQLFNMLPPSLEHLTLTDNMFWDLGVHWRTNWAWRYGLWVLITIVDLVRNRAADLVPHLRHLSIELPRLPSPMSHAELEHNPDLLETPEIWQTYSETARRTGEIPPRWMALEVAKRHELKLACDSAGIALDIVLDPIAAVYAAEQQEAQDRAHAYYCRLSRARRLARRISALTTAMRALMRVGR